jgi:cyclopropane-fatty-acyl-phospholipid synthase
MILGFQRGCSLQGHGSAPVQITGLTGAVKPHSLSAIVLFQSRSATDVPGRLCRFLTEALAAFPWPILISAWDRQPFAVGGNQPHWCGKPLSVHFATPAAARDVLRLNGLGFLERFVRGEVDLTGNLYVLTHVRDYVNLDLSGFRLVPALLRNNLFQTVRRARVNVSSHYDISQHVLETYLDKKYMAYSCAMFERPQEMAVGELVTPGEGEHDDYDSLEKAQWRKFKDAVNFIDPRPGATLLDVGCGYGGQLDVALESYPFGKVVGWTHSRNQVATGRQLLAARDPSRWELHEGDYREETRVFDHVTSTGMVSHVGPRGLAPYVRNIRRRIRKGGRYVHHALMTPYTRIPLNAEPGAAFNKKYVWPGFHWFTLGEHVLALQENGFEILRVTNLSEHYAKTAAAWYERLMAAEPQVRPVLDEPTFRAWQIYLAGGSGSFVSRKSQVCRVYCEAV